MKYDFNMYLKHEHKIGKNRKKKIITLRKFGIPYTYIYNSEEKKKNIKTFKTLLLV